MQEEQAQNQHATRNGTDEPWNTTPCHSQPDNTFSRSLTLPKVPQKSFASAARLFAVRHYGLDGRDGLQCRLFLPLLRDLLFRRRLVS